MGVFHLIKLIFHIVSNKTSINTMDFIIDNWTDIYIEKLIYQQDEYRYIVENIQKLKIRCNKKNVPVFNDLILSLTKPFNDKIFEKYGFDYLLEGINNLIQFECTPCNVIKNGYIIKKGVLKSKNRFFIQKEIQEHI